MNSDQELETLKQENRKQNELILKLFNVTREANKDILFLIQSHKRYVQYDQQKTEDIDAFIKQINSKMSLHDTYYSYITENQENTQDNYETIIELKDRIEELNQELSAIKLIQIISLRQKVKQEEMQK